MRLEEEEEGEQTSDLVQENGAGKPSVESFNVIVDPFDQDDISKSHVGEMSVRMSSGISSVVAREGTFQVLSPRSSINTAIDLEEAYNHLKDGTMIVQMENADIIKDEDEKRGSKKTPESPKGGPEFPPWVINPYFATLKQPNAFWVDSLILILMGGLIGLANLGYKYAITSAPRAYLTIGDDNDYPNSKATVGFATGRLWWIGLGAATGFINAVAKIILKLGNHVGFMGAIQMQKSDPVESLKVVICTIISLVGGSSIGPEAGLAAIGGGIASFLYTRVLRFTYDEDRRYKYYVLAGMSAGFTGFLPSPILAVMMTWELGIPPAFWELNQLHALTLFTMAAVPAAAVFFALEETTLYDPLNIQIPNADDYNPSKYAFAFGILFGIMGALLAIVYHMICNLVRFAFLYPKKYASKYCGPKIGSIAINTLGGVLYGTLGYVMPLTMGDGAFQIQGIIANSGALHCVSSCLTMYWCSLNSSTNLLCRANWIQYSRRLLLYKYSDLLGLHGVWFRRRHLHPDARHRQLAWRGLCQHHWCRAKRCSRMFIHLPCRSSDPCTPISSLFQLLTLPIGS